LGHILASARPAVRSAAPPGLGFLLPFAYPHLTVWAIILRPFQGLSASAREAGDR